MAKVYIGARSQFYSTERGFHAAMKRLGDRVLEWYGADHGWVIIYRR